MSFIKRDVKDRVVQYPRRYQLVEVSQGIYDLVPVTGTVTEEGTAINKAYLQPIEDYLEIVETKNGAQAKVDTLAGEGNTKTVKQLDDEVRTHLNDGTQHAKTARFVIGTSTAGWTAADCDYLCDGTADQTEINNAITALPATGGEIVILDGTYNIAAKIDVTKDNVSIRGNGNATILKRMYNSTTYEGVITLTSRSGCKIADLQVDGNKTSYTNSYNYGIYLDSSSNNTVTGCTCTYNNNGRGIYLNASNNNTVTGNACNNNYYGIYLDSSSNNTVTGNACYNNNYGIGLDYSERNMVTGNACYNNSRGIGLDYSERNMVTGNACIRGTGLATDYTASQHTIWLEGTGNSYNLISNNNCMGKAVTNEGGTGNTLVNNKFN
jgi:parallel beta-helix repeat protein